MGRLTASERLVYAAAFTRALQDFDPYDSVTATSEAAWNAYCAVEALRIAPKELSAKDDPSHAMLHAFAGRRKR